MSDLISRQDAIRILACLLYADAQCLGEDRVMGDCIEEAKAWMSDAPSAEVVLQTPQTYGKSISPNAEIVSDLISRQDAIDGIRQRRGKKMIPPSMDYTFAECIGVIETLPSADAVEVVRCKDCKWFNDRITCPLNTREKTEGRGFCNRGERREDGEA